MQHPRLLSALWISGIALAMAVTVGSFAAVWSADDVVPGRWGIVFGLLVVLASGTLFAALIWTVTFERNDTIKGGK